MNLEISPWQIAPAALLARQPDSGLIIAPISVAAYLYIPPELRRRDRPGELAA